jgi:type IV pilus assembly protein PilX
MIKARKMEAIRPRNPSEIVCTSGAPLFHTQRGAILLITLVSLAILMLSTMALIRSFDTSLSMAGNLAFKRDLSNQAERGMAEAIALVKGGTLDSANVADSNYSATYLDSDAHGLPTTLIASDPSTSDISGLPSGVYVHYVIDRQCNAAGTVEVSRDCSFVNIGTDSDPTYEPVYRISVRATGPRNSQVYLQSTVTY